MRRHGPRTSIFVALAFFLGAQTPARADPTQPGTGGRYALVIGNSDYGGGEDDVSGAKDAQIVAKALADLGFQQVIEVENADLATMRNKIAAFAALIPSAAVVMVFFSGHGFQADQNNYLVPAGGSIDPARSIPLSEVVQVIAMASAPGAQRLVFLDACRNFESSPTKPAGFSGQKIPPLSNTVLAFATGFGQTAEAGGREGYSPYTAALVRHIREPGTSLNLLLDEINTDLTPFGQAPTTSGMLHGDFYFRPVVTVGIHTDQKNLFVLLHDRLVLCPGLGDARAELTAGENDLVVLVESPRSYHNGHTWDRTSDWSYELDLTGPAGPLNCPGPSSSASCFAAGEKAPFKDGPHHGGVFTVAKANLYVDPNAATAGVTIRTADTTAWNTVAGINYQDQETLFEEKVAALPLDQILDSAAIRRIVPAAGSTSATALVALLRDLLAEGNWLGQQIMDPNQTYFAVHGNKLLKDFVHTCVVDKAAERIAAFRISALAILQGKPKPFSSFDENLSQCVRSVGASAGSSLPLASMGVWTAIEDRGRESPEPAGGVSLDAKAVADLLQMLVQGPR